MSQTPNMNEVSGQMFLFERPELLTVERHGALGIERPARPFGFCAKARAVPLTISEVTTAMRDYPVVFNSKEEPNPFAIVGLIDDVNLMVDEAGEWEEHTYVPGYVRRYPFALAAETGGDRMALVLDTAFDGLKPNAERMLFEGRAPSPFTQQALEFSRTYEEDRRLTENVMREIVKFDLIAGQTAEFTPAGATSPKPFAQYFGVDEQKLNSLTDDQFLQLRKLGVLPLLYAQLMSLGNWRSMMLRRVKRYNLTDATALEPRILS